MSDGPSDANRAAREIDWLDVAADNLASALENVKDGAFGYSPQVIGVVNAALKRAGVKVVVK